MGLFGSSGDTESGGFKHKTEIDISSGKLVRTVDEEAGVVIYHHRGKTRQGGHGGLAAIPLKETNFVEGDQE